MRMYSGRAHGVELGVTKKDRMRALAKRVLAEGGRVLECHCGAKRFVPVGPVFHVRKGGLVERSDTSNLRGVDMSIEFGLLHMECR